MTFSQFQLTLKLEIIVWFWKPNTFQNAVGNLLYDSLFYTDSNISVRMKMEMQIPMEGEIVSFVEIKGSFYIEFNRTRISPRLSGCLHVSWLTQKKYILHGMNNSTLLFHPIKQVQYKVPCVSWIRNEQCKIFCKSSLLSAS